MRLILFTVIFLFITVFGDSAVDLDIINNNVQREIDISSQIVKIQYKITAEHKNKGQIKAYSFVLTDEEWEKLSYISFQGSDKKELKYTKKKTSNGIEYNVEFKTPAITQILNVQIMLTKALEPYPAEIYQLESQLVRYFGEVYFWTPYKTLTQKTTIRLSSKQVESYTTIKPVTLVDNLLTYGPYENIEGFTKEKLIVHYENNSPFLTITRLERVIEVSHWGNIAIEETIDILHTGAKLKGSFSRYNFQKDNRISQPCVKSYKTVLPASASDVYYRDTNGNISTSNMEILRNSVDLELRPRFPLFGGWKTHYTLGYNVPSFEYLFNSGDNFMLKMRVIDHVFDDMVVDELIVKVILPEGSKNIKLIKPSYPLTRLPDSLHFTYLDTIGRPVISFTANNLIESHINDFNIKYTFPKIMMLQEPLLIIGFLFILFLLVIIYLRLDFSISKNKEIHQHKE